MQHGNRVIAGETVVRPGSTTASTPIYDQLVEERGNPLASAGKDHTKVCTWSGHKIWPHLRFL